MIRGSVGGTSDSGRKKVGIIGGLGPAASARLYERITEFTDAACDQEHLEVILFSCPQIPDRTNFLLGKPGAPSFTGPMNAVALQLEQLGCEVIASPCNTAHALLDEVTEGLQRARFISMIEVTAQALLARGCRCAGILATEGTRASRVYDRVFAEAGLHTQWPDAEGQDALTRVIYEQVKAGNPVDVQCVEQTCAALHEAGCDAVVLACTELSVIGMPEQVQGMPVFDALDELAVACVQVAGARVRSRVKTVG